MRLQYKGRVKQLLTTLATYFETRYKTHKKPGKNSLLVAGFGVKSYVFVSASDDNFLNNRERNQFVFSKKILFGVFFLS